MSTQTTGLEFVLRFDMGLEPGLEPERERHLRDLLQPRAFRPGPSEQLRLGVTLADGSTANTVASPAGIRRPVDVHHGPSLTFSGGGGGGNGDSWTMHVRAWLWPLPPAGQMTLHYLFDGIGIPEGSIDVDATQLRAASRDVLTAWVS